MGLAAKISIAIDAQTATLQKGFDDARNAIGKLDAGMAGNVAKGMAMFTAGMAAVQTAISAVSGAINSVMGGLSELGALQNFADRTGIAAEQAQALSFAVGQVGVSQDEFLVVLEKLQMKISEAATGTGDAKVAFEQLGLSAASLNQMPLDQKFAAVADAFQSVTNEGDKTRLAMKLFEESGGKLVSILSGGSEALNAYGDEAERLGLLTGGNAEAAVAATRAIEKMKAAWSGFVQQIAALVAPAIEKIASALATVVGWFNSLIGNATGASGVFKSLSSEATKATATVTSAVKTSEKAAKEAAKSIKESFADIPKPSEWNSVGIGAVTRGSAAGFSAVQEAQRERQDRERQHKETIQWLARMVEAQKSSVIRVATVGI